MKLFGNVCYIMGIVVALAVVATLTTAKPVADTHGAEPRCTNGDPVVPPCYGLTLLGPGGIQYTQYDCPGEFTAATPGNYMVAEYGRDACMGDLDVCFFFSKYMDYTHCCIAE